MPFMVLMIVFFNLSWLQKTEKTVSSIVLFILGVGYFSRPLLTNTFEYLPLIFAWGRKTIESKKMANRTFIDGMNFGEADVVSLIQKEKDFPKDKDIKMSLSSLQFYNIEKNDLETFDFSLLNFVGESDHENLDTRFKYIKSICSICMLYNQTELEIPEILKNYFSKESSTLTFGDWSIKIQKIQEKENSLIFKITGEFLVEFVGKNELKIMLSYDLDDLFDAKGNSNEYETILNSYFSNKLYGH